MAADLATVQTLHPEWNITQIALAPNGGIWAVGRDGGVFALNSEGGTAGTVAPYLGSYTGLAPEDRQGTREFTGIRATATGYELLSNIPGQNYAFNAPAAPASTAPVTNITGTNSAADIAQPAQESGKDVFLNSLVQMGFTREQANSLGNNLWSNSKTKTADALYFDLVGSAEYKARFPGMQALRDGGTAISESQYVTLERQYKNAARSAGLPAGFYDSPDDFGKLISNGVSPDEYANRIQWAQTAALSDPTFLDELARQVPGANLGDVTAFYIDPDKGTQYLEQKTIRAQIGTSARTTGFGQLEQSEIDRLQGRGLTAGQAEQGFGALSLQAGLAANTAEETMTDQQFTRSEQIGLVGGEAAATKEFEERRRRRAANFEGGGGAASGGGGRTGLG